MQLRLEADPMGHYPKPQPEVTVLDERGYSIGREPDEGVDWVLPDPTVSGTHARIDYRDSTYYLTDISTNGVFVNGSDQRMNFGDAHRISEGDRFRMGNYVVVANLLSRDESEFEDVIGDRSEHDTDDLDKEFVHSSVLPRDDHSDRYVEKPPDWSRVVKRTDTDQDDSVKGQTSEQRVEITDMHMPPPQFESPASQIQDAVRGSGAPSQYIPGELLQTSEHEEKTGTEEQQAEQGAKTGEPSSAGSGQNHQPTDSVPLNGLQVLLEALGVSDLDLARENTPEVMRSIGLMLREALDGIVKVLRERERFKYELYIRGSVIHVNPLKYAANTKEAISLLLGPHGESHLTPEQAVREAFRDIAAHQQALMEGTIASLTGAGTLNRFDPEKLEQEWSGEISGYEHLFDGVRKAKLWTLFVEEYRKLAQEAEDTYRKEFDQKLARTYADAIERLRGR